MGKSPMKDGILATLKQRPSKSVTVHICKHFPRCSNKQGSVQSVASTSNDAPEPEFALKGRRTVKSLAFRAVFSGMKL